MTEHIYVDRSRVQQYLRCKRARYWEYSAGPQGRGIVPKRISIHLALGLAVHAGLEVLLKRAMDGADMTDESVRRDAENNAVQAALGELAVHLASGVEVDLQEQPERKKDEPRGISDTNLSRECDIGNTDRNSSDSPIVIDFSDLPAEVDRVDVYTGYSFADPVYSHSTQRTEEDQQLREIQIHDQANLEAATGVDDYLKLELAALVEGMTRAYARRRLRPLLAEFEVLEVEREGSWKLGEIPPQWTCENGHDWSVIGFGHGLVDLEDRICGTRTGSEGIKCSAPIHLVTQELWWMSRHDGLLLERATQQLYLLSYKTTGAWDRRKKADAEIDMQGLSEAVDVEKRLGEAWELVNAIVAEVNSYPGAGSDLIDNPRLREMNDRVCELVSTRIAVWLRSQPSPPRILGVRYEYILKGARRQDKKDPAQPGRYVQDSPLIRAYRSDGITASDRRWAPSYEWQDATGKTRRIDYRSWKKAAVWELIPIAQWIDMLDEGDYWPGKGEDYDANGAATDILGDQFVPPLVVYRSDDDLRDWLEQVEAQEVQVALDVAAVRRAEQEGEGAKRSALNRLFGQTRAACSYPGLCQFRPICFGSEDIRRDPLTNSELYQIREANHPIEMAVSE